MRCDPIAQKPRGGSKCRMPVVDALQRHRPKPITEGVVADLRLHMTENPDPFAFARGRNAVGVYFLNRFRHPSSPVNSDGNLRPLARKSSAEDASSFSCALLHDTGKSDLPMTIIQSLRCQNI